MSPSIEIDEFFLTFESSESSEFSSILPNSSPGLAYLAVEAADGVADNKYRSVIYKYRNKYFKLNIYSRTSRILISPKIEVNNVCFFLLKI